jgi:hypothetical protein
MDYRDEIVSGKAKLLNGADVLDMPGQHRSCRKERLTDVCVPVMRLSFRPIGRGPVGPLLTETVGERSMGGEAGSQTPDVLQK